MRSATVSASRSASALIPQPWPTDPRFDPELLAAGDRRNVVDRYRYWTMDAIVADLDLRRMPFHVAVENWQHDLNIGTVVRNANAFLAAAVHIVGERRWNRRGAMVTDRYQHVMHHPTVDDLAAWAGGAEPAAHRDRPAARLAAAAGGRAAAALRAAVRSGGAGPVRGGSRAVLGRAAHPAVRLDPIDQRRGRQRHRDVRVVPPICALPNGAERGIDAQD